MAPFFVLVNKILWHQQWHIAQPIAQTLLRRHHVAQIPRNVVVQASRNDVQLLIAQMGNGIQRILAKSKEGFKNKSHG
jgi:hypothetical protein